MNEPSQKIHQEKNKGCGGMRRAQIDVEEIGQTVYQGEGEHKQESSLLQPESRQDQHGKQDGNEYDLEWFNQRNVF